jgi:predicted nucleic acid-binding protein
LRDRYGITEADVRDVLMILAPLLPTVETDAPVRDPDDRPVIGAAVAGRAEAIVSGDQDLAEAGPLRDWLAAQGVVVLTPGEALDRLAR